MVRVSIRVRVGVALERGQVRFMVGLGLLLVSARFIDAS